MVRYLSISVFIIFFINKALTAQSVESPLRIIPRTPEASTFEKFINFPTISGTGIPEINIPLYTLNYKGYSLPISLSYHASGIKVNDIATPVGLNWVLNAGGFISRDIIGLADEYGWFTFDSIKASSSCIFDDLKPYYDGIYDVAPDIFSYIMPHNNGKFIFKSDKSIRKSNPDPLKIVFNSSTMAFSVFDEFGNTYSFLPKENTTIDVTDNHGGVQNGCDHLNGSGLVGWKLDKITLPTGQEINFSYVEYTYDTDWYRTSNYFTFWGARVQCSLGEESYYGFSSTHISNQTFLPESITTPDEKIQFEYQQDNQLSIMKKELGRISVINRINNDTVRIIRLNHDKYNGNPRLKLTGVEFFGNSSFNKSVKYMFNYETAYLLTMGSCGQDLFGFYNGNTVDHMIPVNAENMAYFTCTPAANREVASGVITNGVLNEIVYPTGGKSRYTFEANITGSVSAPGIRVKSIEFINSDGIVSEKKQFEYSNLSGNTHIYSDFGNYYEYNQIATGSPPRFRDERRWTSSPVFYKTNNFDHNSGFYYGEVKTRAMAGTTTGNTIVEKYSAYTDIFSLTPYLTERAFKDVNDKFVKKERFLYSNSISAYKGWMPFLSYQFYGTDYCNGTTPTCKPIMGYTPLNVFYYQTNRLSLDKKSEVYFFNNEADSVKTESVYQYNKFQLPQKIISTTSTDKKIVKYIHYADDYSLTNLNWLNLMKEGAKYLVGLPVDQRTYELTDQEYLIDGKINEYNENGQILKEYLWCSTTPSSSQVWNSGVFLPANFLLENSYSYDATSKNNVEIITLPEINSYIWGYNNAYPVVKIVNLNQSAIPSAITSAIQGHSFTNSSAFSSIQSDVSYLKSQLSSLLNNMNYMVTFCTYKPLVGMTSETGPDSVTVYYLYDNFGWLSEIRNDDGLLLKKYDYHYANN